jgi:anthranilate phosphoribosyltransferase
MDGECEFVDIAVFLTAMSMKGVVSAEVTGAAQAMRRRATRIRTLRHPLLDTCGTGGDRLHTFNISTATALVASACGIAVAKHGNRSVSSSSGSADVLEALGVNISLTAETAGRCLDELGLAFCFAPLMHGAMRHAAPVRKHLGFPTIFNLLGPLTNPAGAEYQLVGASTIVRAELLAQSLASLGVKRGFVVCGNGELDEISLWGATSVYVVRDGSVRVESWTAESFGLPECDVSSLRVASVKESAAIIEGVLGGSSGAATDIVTANTAAALLVSGVAEDLRNGVAMARSALSTGEAKRSLERLKEWTSAEVCESVISEIFRGGGYRG